MIVDLLRFVGAEERYWDELESILAKEQRILEILGEMRHILAGTGP